MSGIQQPLPEPRRRRDPDNEPMTVVPVRRAQPELGDDPMMRVLLPVGLSGWAIAAGYLGLLSVLFVPAPLALITGILALREMKANPRKHGMGRALFGIIMGSLGSLALLIAAFSLVMAALAR